MEKDKGSNPETHSINPGMVTWTMVYEGIRNEARG